MPKPNPKASPEWAEKLGPALRFVERLPGVTGDRVLRFVGLNLNPASAKFLELVQEKTQVKPSLESTSLLRARFYSASYEFPELFKHSKRVEAGLEIKHEEPQPYSPPTEVQRRRRFQGEQEAAWQREDKAERFVVEVKSEHQHQREITMKGIKPVTTRAASVKR